VRDSELVEVMDMRQTEDDRRQENNRRIGCSSEEKERY